MILLTLRNHFGLLLIFENTFILCIYFLGPFLHLSLLLLSLELGSFLSNSQNGLARLQSFCIFIDHSIGFFSTLYFTCLLWLFITNICRCCYFRLLFVSIFFLSIVSVPVLVISIFMISIFVVPILVISVIIVSISISIVFDISIVFIVPDISVIFIVSIVSVISFVPVVPILSIFAIFILPIFVIFIVLMILL